MKTHRLRMYSLLLLTITTSVSVWAMESESGIDFTELFGENMVLTNDTAFTSQELQPAPQQLSLTEQQTELTRTIELSDEYQMLGSVRLPTEEKGLGFLGTLAYYAWNLSNNVEAYFKTGQFDTNNASHFKLLEEAIAKAIEKKDFHFIATIAALCHNNEMYKNNVRISDTLAQQSLGYLTTKYNQQISDSNDALAQSHQKNILEYNAKIVAFKNTVDKLLEQLEQDVKQSAADYDTTIDQHQQNLSHLQNDIAKFSTFNSNTRNDLQNLITGKLIIQKNEVAGAQEPSAQRKISILKRSTMPTIAIEQQIPTTTFAILDNK